MNLSPAQDAVLNEIANRILQRRQDQSLFVVGISGLDASGKSKISKALSDVLNLRKVNTFVVSGDSFQFPKAYKETLGEENWAIHHVKRILDFDTLIAKVLAPIRQEPATLELDMLDYDTGEHLFQTCYLSYPLVLIVESVYLFQPKLMPYLDYCVWLEISIETALERAQARIRDQALYGGADGVKAHYTEQNFPGFAWFEAKFQPKDHADILIDNTNWETPIILSQNV